MARIKGVCVPLRSSLLRRLLVRQLSVRKMHPNPDDEFSQPEYGPNPGIIARYEKEIRSALRHRERLFLGDPLIMERIRPDGYMLLNGHHRWAAALNVGLPRLPVRVVNLTRDMDIERMLRGAKQGTQATLDLDEVVFAGPEEPAEKPLPFPLRLYAPERVRLGVPALCRYLVTHGCDLWVYTAGYGSAERIRRVLRLHHIRLAGLVTGSARGRNNPGRQALR